MAEAKYRTIAGFVKFPPRDSEVERDGETITVRNILIRNVGVLDQAIDVRATLWPSHAEVAVSEGDFVVVEGKFTVNKTKDSDDNPVTYFNLSVSRILNFGAGDAGERDDAPAAAAASADDDEAW